MVRFDVLRFNLGFPIEPIVVTAQTLRGSISRKQIPLILAWGMTIHNSQGATFNRTVVYLGEKEYVFGMTLVALSRVRRLEDLFIDRIPFDRLSTINKKPTLQLQNKELARLRSCHQRTLRKYSQLLPH